PLYQTYRATVITKEIKRQTVSRNISKTSADFTMDWVARRSTAPPAASTTTGSTTNLSVPGNGLPVATPVLSTLWQDLPAVRESGVLDQLSPEECKYQESMFEVLTSEASYLRSLRVLTDHFLDNRELEGDTDHPGQEDALLQHPAGARGQREDLEDRMDQSLVLTDICDIIHYHAQHNFPAYIDYVRNQIYQDKTYTTLMKNNLQFASNILRRTKERTKEEQTASKALDSVSKNIEECNSEVGKMKRVEELIELSSMLEFDKLKALPIISPTRYLEKKGELGEMSKGGTIFNMRVERVEDGRASGPGPYELCFTLTLLENHQGRLMERLLKAPSQSDMHRWLGAFPKPGNPDRNEEEVIYEDWDCPQVQCVEPYVALQTDELTLEPPEIINVLRKINEGWYEGSRLSDGQKGWFPVGSVVEITNEHVRRRNLRERYRVMQAATQVAAAAGKASALAGHMSM
ncbi:hypothetical protein CRUP_013483, partial [Coryphaenoides rupestris]